MNRNLKLVSVSLCIWGIGEGFFTYFQSLYLQEWGADPILIGKILGAMGIAMAVAQIPAGYLSDRFGSRNIMWASWILGTVSAWIMAMSNSLSFFIVGFIAYSLTGFVTAPMNSYITNVRGNLSVGRALTIPSGLFYLGSVLGPIIGGIVADKYGLRTIYFFAAGFFMLSTLIILFVEKKPETHTADLSSTHSKGLFSNFRFLAFMGITFITLFSLYLPQSFTPNYLQNQLSYSRTTIGLLGACGSFGTAVAALVLGRLNSGISFILGQIWVLIFSILFLTGNSPVMFGFGYFFIGGYRLCRSMILAITRTLIHPEQTGLAYGLMETLSAITLIIAPVLAGYLYRNDPKSIYSVSIVLLACVIICNFVIFKIFNRKKKHQV